MVGISFRKINRRPELRTRPSLFPCSNFSAATNSRLRVVRSRFSRRPAMSRAFAVVTLLLLPFFAAAQEPQAPTVSAAPIAAKPRLKIGVALEGGGALGLAHVGVLQWLEENHIPIDYIAGTSMGALVGGFYAAGVSPQDL